MERTTSKKWLVLVLLISGMLLFSGVARAVPLGFISYDSFIPGPGGVNAFGINNLTGDPATGESAFPPDFPVMDPLTFLGGTWTLTLENGTNQVISLGDIGPGPLLDASGDPLAALQFADSTNFLSATFTATLSQTSFLLSDGSLFAADSSVVSVSLLPSSLESFLTAGSFAVIDAAPASVPEPATLILFGSGVAGLWAWRRKARTVEIIERSKDKRWTTKNRRQGSCGVKTFLLPFLR